MLLTFRFYVPLLTVLLLPILAFFLFNQEWVLLLSLPFAVVGADLGLWWEAMWSERRDANV